MRSLLIELSWTFVLYIEKKTHKWDIRTSFDKNNKTVNWKLFLKITTLLRILCMFVKISLITRHRAKKYIAENTQNFVCARLIIRDLGLLRKKETSNKKKWRRRKNKQKSIEPFVSCLSKYSIFEILNFFHLSSCTTVVCADRTRQRRRRDRLFLPSERQTHRSSQQQADVKT